MAENTPQTQEKEEIKIEGGSYEVIRRRLENQGKELQECLKKLNQARKDVFGSIETTLIATNHISTNNNAIAADMVAIGEKFIFGYNVQVKLKTISLPDVFSVYRYDNKEHIFIQEDLSLMKDAEFEKNFNDLYKYQENTTFSKFFVKDAYIYMVFQVGKRGNITKAFKWHIIDDKIEYMNNRSDHEVKFPEQQEFEWKRAHRDFHRTGEHPHISILDRVFVETVGGDLTVKIEDNTETGEGIYAEHVEEAEQTLDDAEFFYADLGNLILLKIRPYNEKQYRYLIFNDKLKEVVRIDKIEESCILLPDDQGIIFSNGYYLQSGLLKQFDNLVDNLNFEKKITAPNGEDVMYVFHNDLQGVYVLFPYNLIEQKVENPIICNGYSLFEQGEMNYFRAETKPTKNHVIQVWQTPYVGPNYIPPVTEETFLFKVGNKDVVRAMAESNEILSLIYKQEIYSTLYIELVQKTTNTIDRYYWLPNEEAFNLKAPLEQIREAANAAIDEFEKVTRTKQNTAKQLTEASQKVDEINNTIKNSVFEEIDTFVNTLSELRGLRGEVISLKELRYVDLPKVEEMETSLAEQMQNVSEGTVRFLLQESSLDYYKNKVKNSSTEIEGSAKVTEIQELEQTLENTGDELELLIDVVSNLKIEDSTQTTKIIDNISTIYASLNQVKSEARCKKKDLQSVEAVAEFNAQLKLISQGVINYLDISDTPEKAEEYLTKLMIQLEELEGKFADFDEFTEQITEKREEIYNAFESKKIVLSEARNKRTQSLQNQADRILKGIRSRVSNFKTVNEINGYFASDLMIEKIRDIIKKLTEFEDTVKADEIQSRLKTLKEDAVRQLKDKQDMFVEGENVIKFGRHRFSVSTQNLDLSIIRREEDMYFHLTGTNFFEEIKDESFLSTRDVWEQELPSENKEVYRGEYLSFLVYQALNSGKTEILPTLAEFKIQTPEQQLEAVRKFSATRYNEGYIKGTNDQDALKILSTLLELNANIDLLRYPSVARACASHYWISYLDKKLKAQLNHRLKGVGVILQVFPHSRDFDDLLREVQENIRSFIQETQLFQESIADLAGEYLFYEITRGDNFIISAEAAKLYQDFLDYLKKGGNTKLYEDSLYQLREIPRKQYLMIKDWLRAFIHQVELDNKIDFPEEYLEETASLLFHKRFEKPLIINISVSQEIEGMLGNHPTIKDKKYTLHYNDFMQKLTAFNKETLPRYQSYINLKKELTETFRDELKVEQFKPRVLSSFVRNRLINEVYLPIIGDNLAKQIGVVGEAKRTDLMGMLLLISPPGYGKTTLMEYISSRLGLIFMKINGPALGHNITSLDPNEASNASAREEINRLNLAFEMGDNVMVYLDDIQHCNPEFLQKFISLSDGQRKIEGVYKGKPKTYDLRGRKVVVVMAGNPYTESGEKFQIPDMLANRADTYNLGDIIGDTAEAFELSYIENSLTSNPTLNKLATRSQKDIYTLVRIAATDNREGVEFEGNYSGGEIQEYVAVLKKMIVVRDYVLRNNLEYIRSAAQSDEFRTEPPFKLQGSYRNMNKIAEKIVPIMNDAELQTLIMSHYENEAQTLATGAEANILKFKEIHNLLNEEEQARWNEIKTTFQKNNKFKGLGSGDQMTQVLAQLSDFNEGLAGIRDVIADNVKNGE